MRRSSSATGTQPSPISSRRNRASRSVCSAALAAGLGELLLLWRSREPLEAFTLQGLPELCVAAYRRGCYLIAGLASLPPDEAPRAVQALLALREALRAGDDLGAEAADVTTAVRFDGELLFCALERLLPADGRARPRSAAVVGAAAGLLHLEGRLERAELAGLLAGYLRGVGGDANAAAPEQTAFVFGLLAAARELGWREPALVAALDALLAQWDDATFLRALPELRLAFAQLTPRESDRVAVAVSGLSPTGEQVCARLDVPEALLLRNAAIDGRVGELVEADGLASWLEAVALDGGAQS